MVLGAYEEHVLGPRREAEKRAEKRVNAEWRNWNERRLEAELRGERFDEPSPATRIQNNLQYGLRPIHLGASTDNTAGGLFFYDSAGIRACDGSPRGETSQREVGSRHAAGQKSRPDRDLGQMQRWAAKSNPNLHKDRQALSIP